MITIRTRPLTGGGPGEAGVRRQRPPVRSIARRLTAGRLPRSLHPVAWWIWAISLAAAASRTSNPLLLLLIFAVISLILHFVLGRRAV